MYTKSEEPHARQIWQIVWNVSSLSVFRNEQLKEQQVRSVQ